MIEWLPTLSVDAVNVATPPTTGDVPSVVAPYFKVTVPVGVPAVATTAWNVTGWFGTEGLAPEESWTLVGWRATEWLIAADVLGRWVASPE